MFISNEPREYHVGTIGAMPTLWAGVDVPDGDGPGFITAPVGSVYWYLDGTNGVQRQYTKCKNDSTDNDWVVGLHCITKTVTRAMMTDGGSTSGTYALGEKIPANAWVLRTVLVDVTGFTGDTSAVIIVGDGSDTDRYNTSTPSVFTTAQAIDLGAPSGTQIHTAQATVTITITSGADFTNVSAGSLTLRLYYLA